MATVHIAWFQSLIGSLKTLVSVAIANVYLSFNPL